MIVYGCFSFPKPKGDEDVGVKVRVRVQKSKVCPNFVQFLLCTYD
jgi:hypothetical protein